MRDEKTRASWRKSKRKTNPIEATSFGESGRSRRRFLFRVSALATSVVALVALLIWLLQQGPDQDVPLIVVAITESSGRNDTDALFAPPNHYAFEDVQLLQACFGKESDQQVVVASKRTGVLEVEHDSGTSRRSALVSSVADQVAKVTPGGVNGDLVAVCLTAQGLVEGEIPYLLVGNSRPEDPSTWIRVDDLFAAIVDTLQDESQRRVVLLLDANRAGVIWDWGKLDNSFTGACSKVAERVAGDRLAVIVSCGEGERSWWDPQHQQSLFVRAVAEALTGRSDRNEDEIITVGEIVDYLDSRVASNADAIWAARQRPQLLTDSRDWEFIRTPAPTELPVLEKMNSERKLSELRTTLNRLDELWERREKVAVLPHPPLVTSPLAWGALDKRLARLDQLLFAGAGYELELEQMIDECTNLLSTMEQGPPASLEVVPEIRLLEYFHGPYQRTVEEELFLADWRDDPSADAKQFTEVFNDNTERRLTEILWPWLLDQPSLKGHLVSAERLLARKNVGTSSPTEFVESHLIRLLAAPDLEHVRNNDYAAAVLKSHRKSRDAYFPEDIRASFWTRSRASELSTQRMDLFDQLLSTADASAVPAALDRVTEQYEELQRTADRISEGYRLRDQLLHRVPRIAETLLSDIDAFETEESETKTVELVRRATDTSQCLRAVLRLVDAGEYPLDLIEKGEFDRAYANARSALSALEDRLYERAENAENINAQDSRGLRRAFAMLNGSALDGDRRKGIRDRLFDTLPTFSGAEAGNSVAATSEADSSVDVSATDSPDMSLLTISSHHPLNYWLQRSQQANCESGLAATDKSLTLQGSEIRNWLLQDPDYLSIRNSPEQRSADGEQLADVRSEVDDLDTSLRCRLCLISARDELLEEAMTDRFALDTQLFLMDHANRTIREFWCEARDGEASQAFFPDAAERLLGIQVFRQLKSRTLDGDDLNQKLRSARNAAQNEQTLVATPGSIPGLPRNVRLSNALLDDVRGKNLVFKIECPDAIPGGEVAVTRQADVVPVAEREQEALSYSIQLPPDFPESVDFFAVDTFYRGLRRHGGISIVPPGEPDTTVFELPMYPPPAALVQRGEQAPQRIMLVLDCSRSMKKGARLRDAQLAVKRFLNNLPAKNVSVGLIVFGHRYGWVQDGVNLAQPVNPDLTNVSLQRFRVEVKRDGRTQELKAIALNDQLTGHNPNFDVEVVANLAPLSPRHRQILINEVDNADALGVTPTYQAIVEAYRALGGQGGYIVVMTDGKPFLAGTKLSSTGLDEIQENSRASAAEKFEQNKNGVQLRIINFANNASQAELEETFPGSVHQADNADNLLKQLQAGIKRPKVSWQSDGKVVSQEGDLEKAVAIDQWPPTPNAIPGQLFSPRKYTVTATADTTRPAVYGTDVWVEGGELFELEMQDKQLVHVPYPRSRDVLKELETSGGGDGITVSAIAPILDKNLELELIIENKDATRFTPRPSDIWIELVGSDEQGRPLARYSITLAQFVPRRRVPTLICRVNNWPERAKTVNIDAWFRFGDPVAERIELRLDRDQTTINEFPGVKFAVKQINGEGGYRIEVTERHDNDSDVRSLRILPDPIPKRAVTSYFEGSGVTRRVVRAFEFDRRPDSLKLFVTKRDQIAGGNSVHATRTLRISDR